MSRPAMTYARADGIARLGDTVDGLHNEERAAFAAGLLERLEDDGRLFEALDYVGPSTFLALRAYVACRVRRVQP